MNPCPCRSRKAYEQCCKPYHNGAPAENALVLMRSRYSAYALGLANYIIATTHPKNPFYTADVASWKKSIAEFSHTTSFEDLEIVEVNLGTCESWVTFIAYLKQGNKDVSFREKSLFVNVDGKWLYKDGVIKSLA